MTLVATLAALSLMSGSSAALAQDDRPPTSEERAAIEQVLRSNGFVSWDDIELDDGVWEVDDARTADGAEHDLKLRPGTLEIIQRKADTDS